MTCLPASSTCRACCLAAIAPEAAMARLAACREHGVLMGRASGAPVEPSQAFVDQMQRAVAQWRAGTLHTRPLVDIVAKLRGRASAEEDCG